MQSDVPKTFAGEVAQRPLLLALGWAAFVVSLDGRLLGPLLPAIADSFDLSIAEASWTVSAYMLPYGFCQLAYGPLADRFGKVRVAGFAMLAFSALAVLGGGVRSFAALVALRGLTGAAAAALIPLTMAYIGDTVPYARRQASLAMLMATSGAAQALGLGAGAVLAEALSWHSVFPVLGCLSLATTFSIFAHQKRELRPERSGSPPRYRDALGAPGMGRLLVLVAVEGFLYMGANAFLSGLLEERFHMPVGEIGLVLGAGGLAQWLAARAMPRLLRAFGERELILLGGFAMASCFVLAAVAGHFAWVVLGGMLAGAGFTTCHSTLQTRATEAFPQGRASALALFACALCSGAALGTTVLAKASHELGYGVTFGVVGAALVVFTLVCAQPLVTSSMDERELAADRRRP